MTPSAAANGDAAFHVGVSAAVAAEIRRRARQAASERRGGQIIAALRRIIRRLGQDPRTFGDPNYRLQALRLQVRSAIVPPIVVYFADSDDRPEVYVKALKLL